MRESENFWKANEDIERSRLSEVGYIVGMAAMSDNEFIEYLQKNYPIDEVEN